MIEQYNKLVQQNKELQTKVQLQDKMIELMADLLHVFDVCSAIEDIDCMDNKTTCEDCIKNHFKQQAIKELEVSNAV